MQIGRTITYYILLTLFAGIAISCGRKTQQEIIITPEIEKNHLQLNHIFGQVKEITQEVWAYGPVDSLRNNGTLVATTIQRYSADGYLTSVISIDEYGDTVSIRTINYDGDARELNWEEKNNAGEIIESCQYLYDMNHFKVGEKHFKGDSLTVYIKYKTDGLGNPIEIVQQYDQFELTNRVTYNTDGLTARIDEFEPNGKLFKYITIEYDNYGDEVNRRAFKAGDQLIEYTYTEYDNEGRMLKKIFEDRLHEMQEVYVYSEHDSQGNWTKEEINKLGNIAFQRVRKYIYY